MSPRELIRVYAQDERLSNGRFFSEGGLDVSPGDHVGVVLMVPGAPGDEREVSDYIYRRLMGPTRDVTSVTLWIRHVLAGIKARRTASQLKAELDSIGGAGAIHRMNREQAEAVEREIRSRSSLPDSVRISTYLGSPFGAPDLEATARQMKQDEVSHVILFPLFPQYSAGTTGRGLAEWEAMLREGSLPRWPTVAMWEFSSNEKYIEAISDRINQAIRRFPRHIRDEVHLLFAAHGQSPTYAETPEDPYCCMVHGTVDAVMKRRSHDRLFTLSFVRDRILGRRISPELRSRLQALQQTGCRSVLVIPVDYVSEQFDTSYMLDVKMREVAENAGITHYHVATGLNCHPLFIEAMADLVIRRIVPGTAEKQNRCLKGCPRSSWHMNVKVRQDRELEQRCALCPYRRRQMEPAAERESSPLAQSGSRSVINEVD